jgi:hypothetical protein
MITGYERQNYEKHFIQLRYGAAGDMLMAALLELHPHPQNSLKK